jgi:hypothetical protein
MSDNKILQFPRLHRDAIDDEQWRAYQGEFYLDSFISHHGFAPEEPEQLRTWLQEVQLFADLENPFFRGWLLRRLSEGRD